MGLSFDDCRGRRKTSRLHEKLEIVAMEDPKDPTLRDTPRATSKGRRRVFTGGFPRHVEEFIPSHPFTVIPTACGVASAAAAELQIEPAP